MSRPLPQRQLDFHLSVDTPCPYLDGRLERKVFAAIDGSAGESVVGALALVGFRRSQSIVYRPACVGCAACLSARVLAQEFTPSRTQKRVTARNQDLVRTERPPEATQEQYELLSRYLTARHADGGMSDMTFGDYAMMVGETPTQTTLAEYRTAAGALMAAVLLDRFADGDSLVYSFFEPEAARRSLGAFVILDAIRHVAALGRRYVYLGYWVKGSAKMAYKAGYRPLEVLRGESWAPLAATDAAQNVAEETQGETV